MVFLLLISLGFRYRKNLLAGYARVIREVFWTGSFALLTSAGIIFFKRTPFALRHQTLPQSAWWAQRGILLLLVLEIFFLSFWFPEEEEDTVSGEGCPSPYLLSGICAGIVSGNAYVLSVGTFTLPYMIFLSVFGILFFLIARCRHKGVYLTP